MPDLTPSDFPAFFTALWKKEGPEGSDPLAKPIEPFPWQRRLAEEVCREGHWPAALDLPTSAGKTAAVDIAVFHLALEADKPGRRAPVRIVYVVDRRLVVDSTWDRARAIGEKLEAALEEGDSGILNTVAERLMRLAGPGARPLAVARLRGGMPREDDWATSPTQPLVVCSTVDQAGSRLLFRGYGVSDRMKPVHAGLLGSDALWLLDEAHLANPLRQTLKAIVGYRRSPWVEYDPLAPLAVVELSATRRDNGEAPADDGNERPFQLDAEDEANAVLRQRLFAPKPAPLVLVNTVTSASPAPADDMAKVSTAPVGQPAPAEPAPTAQVDKAAQERTALVNAYVVEAVRLASIVSATEPAPVVGVVVNRVRLAREIAEALRAKVQPEEPPAPGETALELAADSGLATAETTTTPAQNRADVELIIGPSRPLDREAQLEDLLPRMRAQGRQNDRPLYVVATQTIEVGADLDFDALVTQIAPLDALRQRFGRLNRLGRCPKSPAAILATKDEVATSADDPVYGSAAAATWKWLNEVATSAGGRGRGGRELSVDFGIASMKEHLTVLEASESGRLQVLTKAPPDAPILFPSYVELWAQTWPIPAADPEPALFLHGPETGSPDVTIVWRSDLSGAADAKVAEIIDALPPSPLEGVQVSLAEARRWLRGEASGNLGDVEGDEGKDEERRDDQERKPPVAWRWDGKTCRRQWGNQTLHSGAVLVARAEGGGCDAFGWNPASTARVRDRGEQAALRQRRRLVLRLHHGTLADELRAEGRGDEANALWARVKGVIDEHAADRASILIAALRAIPSLPPRWDAYLSELSRSEHAGSVEALERYGEDLTYGLILRLRRRLESDDVERIVTEEASLSGPEAAMAQAKPRRRVTTEDAGSQEATTDEEDGEGGSGRVSLRRHVAGVERYARLFAAAAGLPPAVRAAVVLAAHLHDTGKEEQRFQAFLRGGDLWLTGGAPLAKSGKQWSRTEVARIHERVGLPAQSRHECWSVRLAECYLAQAQDIPCTDFDDFEDLVRWLVGTHHGYGRPFFPAVTDERAAGELRVRVERAAPLADAGHSRPEAGEAAARGGGAVLELRADVNHGLTRLDSDWPGLFARLLRRYGPWELARLEAILRLADHRASSEDQQPEKEGRAWPS